MINKTLESKSLNTLGFIAGLILVAYSFSNQQFPLLIIVTIYTIIAGFGLKSTIARKIGNVILVLLALYFALTIIFWRHW